MPDIGWDASDGQTDRGNEGGGGTVGAWSLLGVVTYGRHRLGCEQLNGGGAQEPKF